MKISNIELPYNFVKKVFCSYYYAWSRLSKINGEPLAVSGYGNNKVESYNVEMDTWTELEAYPYHSYIAYFATVTTDQGAFIIGGTDSSRDVSTIARFDSNEWTKICDLL